MIDWKLRNRIKEKMGSEQRKELKDWMRDLMTYNSFLIFGV